MFNYHGEALLILDGFGPHDCDEFLDLCSENGVIVFPLPPHSSDQCQPLDLGIFHVQKSRMQRMTVDTSLCAQTIQIIKMLDSFEQATTVSNVVSVFRAVGILSKYDDESQMLMPYVDKSFAKKVRHWNHEEEKVFEHNKKRISVDIQYDHFENDIENIPSNILNINYYTVLTQKNGKEKKAIPNQHLII